VEEPEGPAAGCAARRARLVAALDAERLDALLVIHPVNVRYLAGFTGSSGALLVRRDGEALLATDGRYAEQAAAEAPDMGLEITRADEWLAGVLAPGTRLGLEGRAVTWERLDALAGVLEGRELVRTTGTVEALRATKDEEELALLRRACAVTAQVVAGVPGWLAPGQTERQIARRIHDEMISLGADDRAFPPIVATGPNTARPHHQPTERPAGRGDLVQLDVGALVGGYHADMSRVFALGVVPTVLRDAHAVVVEAQQAGRERVEDGCTAGDVDAACRDVIEAAGHGRRFVHPSGHAVGLEIHEEPILRAGSTARLRSRMAVTVEPGIYLPGLGGIRVEDVVIVTDAGATVLTQAPRDLVVV
jgi:Xaa-Pro aminopeptidase